MADIYTEAAVAFAIFLFGILLEPIVFEPILGPVLRYRYAFLRKRIWKYAVDHKVRVEINSKSEDISELKYDVDRMASSVAESLRPIAKVERRGSSVFVSSIVYGGLEASGVVNSSMDLRGGQTLVDGIQITLEADCGYRKFSDQVLELSRCIEQMKDAIRGGLKTQITFDEFLGAKLSNIYELTGILSDLKLNYMNLGGELSLTLGQKDATIAKVPFSSKAIDTLKHLAVLYS